MAESYWLQIKKYWNEELSVNDEFFQSDLLETLIKTNYLQGKASQIKKLRSNLSTFLIRLEKKGIAEVKRSSGAVNIYKKLGNDIRTYRKSNKKWKNCRKRTNQKCKRVMSLT